MNDYGWPENYAAYCWDAYPVFERLKMLDILCRAKPYLEKSFNGGEQIKRWVSIYFINAYEDLFNNGSLTWKGTFWDFDALKPIYKDKVPTLERFKELPLWSEISQSEKERLIEFFNARPLFLEKRINRFFRRFLFPEDVTIERYY